MQNSMFHTIVINCYLLSKINHSDMTKIICNSLIVAELVVLSANDFNILMAIAKNRIVQLLGHFLHRLAFFTTFISSSTSLSIPRHHK